MIWANGGGTHGSWGGARRCASDEIGRRRQGKKHERIARHDRPNRATTDSGRARAAQDKDERALSLLRTLKRVDQVAVLPILCLPAFARSERVSGHTHAMQHAPRPEKEVLSRPRHRGLPDRHASSVTTLSERVLAFAVQSRHARRTSRCSLAIVFRTPRKRIRSALTRFSASSRPSARSGSRCHTEPSASRFHSFEPSGRGPLSLSLSQLEGRAPASPQTLAV